MTKQIPTIAISGDGQISIASVSYGHIKGFCRDTSVIEIGECRQITASLCAWNDGEIRIGDKTSINGAQVFAQASKIRIGKDCMLSDGITIMGSDQHVLVELETMSAINLDKRDVTIEDHVWVGRGSTILPGITIGHGAVIGAGSVVTRSVPPQSAVAGNPARLIRSNISWSRDSSRVGGDLGEYLASLPSDAPPAPKSD